MSILQRLGELLHLDRRAGERRAVKDEHLRRKEEGLDAQYRALQHEAEGIRRYQEGRMGGAQ